jgi:SAM-dependent methyltransferase
MPTTPYSSTFYKEQRDASMVAGHELLPLVFSYVPCKSLLDVGCGVGPWVAAAQQLGVAETLGVDGSYVDKRLLFIPEEQFISADLSQPFDMQRRYDLVISLEVAEHIAPSSADIFVENLTRHSDAILFSAAIPGQGGTHHVNEQWPAYWQEKFASRGYQRFDVLRNRVWENQKIPCCYRQNAFFYINSKSLDQYPALQQRKEDHAAPVAWVHPDIFSEALSRPAGLRRLLRELPGAVRLSLTQRTRRALGR